MKKQIFYGITFHFENFNHSFDADLLGEMLYSRFLSECGLKLKRRELSDYFKSCFPYVTNIVLYQVKGREGKFVGSQYLISKTF